MDKLLAQRLKFLKITNLICCICIFISLLSYCIFFRGLESDGVERLAEILFKKSFFHAEKARMLFHLLYEWPLVFYLKIAPSPSLLLIKSLWSFSLIYLHLFSLAICYLYLPKSKKDFIFFPLMGFVFGPMTSLGLSVSVSFIVCSYYWALAFIIHYSDLYVKQQKAIFILSICFSFFSHELMSYMAWPLIYFCFLKLKKNKENKSTIYTGVFLLTLNSLLSAFFTVFPEWPSHRSYFIESLIYLKFFYSSGFYAPAVSSFLILILFFMPFLFHKKNIMLITVIILSAFFCCMNVINPIYPIFGDFIAFWNEYDKRVWVIIALPITLLIWWLFETKRVSFLQSKSFLIFCLILTVSLTGWRVGSDYRFYQYQSQFAEKLSHCLGWISWSKVQKFSDFHPPFLKQFYNLQVEPDEHIIDASLLYSKSFQVQSIVQSHSKPLWLCADFYESQKFSIFHRENHNLSEMIQDKCKAVNLKNISMNFFDFIKFIKAVQMGQSHCKYKQ